MKRAFCYSVRLALSLSILRRYNRGRLVLYKAQNPARRKRYWMSFADFGRSAQRIVAFGLACAGLLLLVWLVAWADRGFVFSDEAFYLLNAKAPASFNVVQTQFGYLLQPFYFLTGENVAAVRRIFIFLIAGAGIMAGWIWSRQQDVAIVSRISLIAVTGASALACYFFWVFTPSYNLLVFLSGLLLIGAVGALYTLRPLPAPGILIGTAAMISVLAKATSAAFFALIAGLAIILLSTSYRAIGRGFLAIGAITLLFVGIAAALLPLSRIAEQLTAYTTFFGVRCVGWAGSVQ